MKGGAAVALLPMPFSNPHTYPGHSGVDFPQPAGTPIRASSPGVVTSRNKTTNGGYTIWVAYDGHSKHVGYAHMPSHKACPAPGTRVDVGTKLGVVGSTGRSTGPHLHLEISGDATTAGVYRMFDKGRVVGQGTPAGGGSSINYDAKVAGIQQALINDGIKVKKDGIDGPQTKEGIETFQRKHGLFVDGIWGPKTNAMNNHLAVLHRPTLKKGSKGSYVELLQRKLGLKVDGIFGAATDKAVRAFQKKNKLTTDGVVGRNTWLKVGY